MCTSRVTCRLSLCLALVFASLPILVASCRDSEPLLEPDDTGSDRSFAETAATDPAVFVGAGDIATCGSGAEATGALLDAIIAANAAGAGYALRIFTTGDNAYPDGLIAEYLNCYDPTWGSGGKKAITSPTPGNHEYHDPGGAGYFQYYGADAPEGPLGREYYSYDFGAWHASRSTARSPSARAIHSSCGWKPICRRMWTNTCARSHTGTSRCSAPEDRTGAT